MVETPALQQVSLSLSVEKNAIVPATATSRERRDRDLRTVRHYLEEKLDSPLAFNLDERLPPFNICITKGFASHVKDIHILLDRALIDIVERWFSDESANFPTRMPLEQHEEDLLRWIDGPASEFIPRFSKRYGMYRTDYLIERDASGVERARICEINARIPFNGFWVVGLHEEATKSLGAGSNGFEIANNFENTIETILSCFDKTKPVYHIRAKWPGVDSKPLAVEYKIRTGQSMIVVDPKDLQLRTDSLSPTGYSLWLSPKRNNEQSNASFKDVSQRIDQCSMELFQQEIAEIAKKDPLLLRQLATCCVNDFRNILLLHDKRVLGILLEELPTLIQRKCLTANEAGKLQDGIANTLMPGTTLMTMLLEQSIVDETIKDEYIIKPARDASGQGIVLGARISQKQWLDHLAHLSRHKLHPNEDTYIVQKLVHHVWYDIVRHDIDFLPDGEKFHLIASGHMINSKLFVYGPWRIGKDVHVGVTREKKGIVMSAVLRPHLRVFESKEGLK